MRTYETLFIVHPEIVGDEYAALVEKYKGIIQDQGGQIHKVDEWGTRKLAYLVKKQARGTYILAIFDAEAQVIAELERRMRLDESVLKYQTVVLEKGYQEPAAETSVKNVASSDEDSDELEEEETEENA